jgi:hypothetical protein
MSKTPSHRFRSPRALLAAVRAAVAPAIPTDGTVEVIAVHVEVASTVTRESSEAICQMDRELATRGFLCAASDTFRSVWLRPAPGDEEQARAWRRDAVAEAWQLAARARTMATTAELRIAVECGSVTFERGEPIANDLLCSLERLPNRPEGLIASTETLDGCDVAYVPLADMPGHCELLGPPAGMCDVPPATSDPITVVGGPCTFAGDVTMNVRVARSSGRRQDDTRRILKGGLHFGHA